MKTEDKQDPNPQLEEFLSTYYGRPRTALMWFQIIAIWITFFGIFAVVLAPVILHGKSITESGWSATAVFGISAIVFQWLAMKEGRRICEQKVTWDSKRNVFTFFQFRVFRGFLSRGEVHQELEISPAEISSAKKVIGRGRHVRLQTDQGFLIVSNDIEGFDRLSELLLEAADFAT